jgi:hypothetical protein
MKCPFEIGDKIVCIEPNYYKVSENKYQMSENMPYLSRITTGKIYEVVEIDNSLSDNIGIINDIGVNTIPRWEIFISLKEHRRRKLMKINNS